MSQLIVARMQLAVAFRILSRAAMCLATACLQKTAVPAPGCICEGATLRNDCKISQSRVVLRLLVPAQIAGDSRLNAPGLERERVPLALPDWSMRRQRIRSG